jgi:hypothetical protein
VKFVLALITLLSVVAHADDLVFKKQMPNKQSVIVTRTEIPKNNELSPQQKAANAKWLKDNPGYFLGPTSDHRYRYTYSLTFADGKHQVLWTNEAETFGEAPPPGQIRVGSSEAQVLDVAVEESKNEHSTIGNDKTLVVLYKGAANIIQPGPRGSRVQLTWRESSLVVPVSGLDGLIVSGRINGTLKASNLTATLTSETGKVFVYRWQGDAWSLVPAPTVTLLDGLERTLKSYMK